TLRSPFVRRIPIDREHQRARGAVQVVQARRPNRCRFPIPVRGIPRLLRRGAQLLVELRIAARIATALLLGCIRRFAILGISGEALGKGIELPRIHRRCTLPPPKSPEQRGSGGRTGWKELLSAQIRRPPSRPLSPPSYTWKEKHSTEP